MQSRFVRFVLVFAAVLLSANLLYADPPARPGASLDIQAIPSGTPIVVDGVLNEPVWEQTTPISEFIQRDPAEGEPPSHPTEARIAFDDNAIYVAVRAHDTEADKIVGILTRRDQRSPSDWIRVAVDSYYDRRSAYEFGVNPVGVKTDRYYFNDGNSDDSWDAVWDVQVGRDAQGWTAEFRIPFSQLRFNAKDGGPIGFAVIREVGRLAETSSWPLLSRNATGFVSQFAEVRGLRMAATPKKFEFLPYTLGSFTKRPESGNQLVKENDPDGSVGLDLKYAVTPGLTLTGAVNPDFGQVEADPAVVNLDAFEVFFQERRPFFVEGSGNFQFNIDCNDGACTGLFYSRRIGRAPQGTVTTTGDEQALAPAAATIIGAGKLTGRAGKFSIGALTAITAEESANIVNGLDRREQTVEPLTGYSVMRARREFANQSNIGFMVTSTARQLVGAVDFLPSRANTGGVDYDIRLGRRYNFSGFWAGSNVAGSTEAMQRLQENNVHLFQRTDADYLDVDYHATSLSGHAGSFSFGKIGGEKTRFSSYVGYKTPGFEINDLGFERRADERTMSNWFQIRDNVPGRFTRSFMINFNQWAGWNFGGDRTFSGGNVNMHWTWKNYYSTGMGINLNAPPLRDRVTRGGPAVLGNSNYGIWYYANTDNRKAVTVGYNGFHDTDQLGTTHHNIGPFVNWRATSALSINTSFRYNINNDDSQWVENVSMDAATHYVFGRLKQRTSAFTFRVNYTLTPTLSIQTYAEPFVSAGDYADFKEVTEPRAAEYADRYQPYGYLRNPDFNYRSFRSTNVMRWEYKPGSSLFVVWQQGRSDSLTVGDFRFARDFGGIFHAPSQNVFLVKLTYWLNM